MYDYMIPDPLEENSFRLIKLKEDVDHENPPYQQSDIEHTIYVRHQSVVTPKSTTRLQFQCSNDNVNWTDVVFDYEGFKQQVSEEIKKMIAEESDMCMISLSWLKGFEIIHPVRYHLNYKLAKYCIGMGYMEEEDWKSKVWNIFYDLEDSFWNSHRIRFMCYLQSNETGITLSANYNSKSISIQQQQQREAESMSNYHAFLLNALHILLLCPFEKDELPLETCIYVCWSGGSDQNIAMRVLDRQLADYGASLIRKHHDFYVSRSRPLQEQEREAVKKRCSETITTLQTLHPTLYLITARHKEGGNPVIVGCYREKDGIRHVMKYLKKKFPGNQIEYEVSPIVSLATSTELLQKLDSTDEVAVSNLYHG